MNMFWKGAALGSATLLAACGGGSDSDSTSNAPPSLISADEEVLRLFSDTRGDIADVLSSSSTALVAREVSEATWRETYAGSGSYELVDGEFSIEADGDDLLVRFGEEGGQKYVYRIVDAASINDSQVRIDVPGGDYFDLFISGSGTISDLFDPNFKSNYARRVGLYYSPAGEDFGLEYRTVVGTETRDSMISDLAGMNAKATYQGFAGIMIRDADAGWNTFNGGIAADLDMEADFGAGTISGTMSNLFVDLRNGPTTYETRTPAGTIRLDEAAIRENAFQGSMSPDATLSTADPGVAEFASSGTYSGAFYGPNAEEVGGSMTFDAEVNGNRLLGIGAYTADSY